jgi:ribonuclease HI
MTKGWVESWRKRGWVKWDKTPAANADLWEELLAECAKHRVTFEWVRGHQGVEENERCDELSKEMAMQDNLPPDTGYESQLSPQRLKQLLGRKYQQT